MSRSLEKPASRPLSNAEILDYGDSALISSVIGNGKTP